MNFVRTTVPDAVTIGHIEIIITAVYEEFSALDSNKAKGLQLVML